MFIYRERNEELGLSKGCRKGLWTEETLGQSQRWGGSRPGLAADPEKDPELDP